MIIAPCSLGNQFRALFGLASIALLSSTALAQLPLPNQMLWGMPDVDQRRNGLEAGGNVHCIPTAHLNMLLYIEGQDQFLFDLVPTVSNPQLNSEHEDITAQLLELGELMNVDPFFGGTTLTKAVEALPIYLGSTANLFTFTSKYGAITRGDMYWPLNKGGLVSICYGRWQPPSGGQTVYVRNGGHCVTLMGVKDFYFPLQPQNQPMRVRIRDPWTDDGDLSKQSRFSSREIIVRGFEGDCQGYPTSAVFQELVLDPPADTRRLVDSVSYILPLLVLKQTASTQFTLSPAIQLHPFAAADDAPVQLSSVNQITQAQNPLLKYVTEAIPGGETRLSLVGFGQRRSKASITLPTRETRITTGRRDEVYVVGAGQLRCLASDDNDRLVDLFTPFNFSTLPDALAYNDATDELLVYTANQISEFQRTLPRNVNPTIRLFAVPPSFAPSATRRMIVGDGAARKYWFGPLADGSIKCYQPDPQQSLRMVLVQSVSIPGGSTGVTDFALDDAGNPIILRNGALQPLRFNLATGRWETNTSHPFNNLNLGGINFLSLSRSRSNFDRAIHDNPGWNSNIPTGDTLGIEVADCLADIGRQGAEPLPDGILDNNDFIVFIDWFFASDSRADIASQGAAEEPDSIFDNNDFVLYIQRFFTPCN
jgi:hypothetical protein